MMPVRIKLVNFGQVEREYRELVGFYERRIASLCRLSVVQQSKNTRIGAIPENAVLLDPRGPEMSSDEFFEFIKKESSNGRELVFVVGPPEGFPEDVRSGKKLLSLSRMTLRHELAYLILLEQIYRALLRMKGTRYER